MRKAALNVSFGWISSAAFAAGFEEKIGLHGNHSFRMDLPVTSRKWTAVESLAPFKLIHLGSKRNDLNPECVLDVSINNSALLQIAVKAAYRSTSAPTAKCSGAGK
jgi:hypothetical protein